MFRTPAPYRCWSGAHNTASHLDFFTISNKMWSLMILGSSVPTGQHLFGLLAWSPSFTLTSDDLEDVDGIDVVS